MTQDELQHLCDAGQLKLMACDYLQATHLLAWAESVAYKARDFDSLARLYMPLQEARRLTRQRCGEGAFCLRSASTVPLRDSVFSRSMNQPLHGQFALGGFADIRPSVRFRHNFHKHALYADTFLTARYFISNEMIVTVIAPLETTKIPRRQRFRSVQDLARELPPECVTLLGKDIPPAQQLGDNHSFAFTMALYERLHYPFLARARATADPIARLEAYRTVIRVDYACEFAHQELSKLASQLARSEPVPNYSAA